MRRRCTLAWFPPLYTKGGSHAYSDRASLVAAHPGSREADISPLAKGNAYNSTLAYTHSSDLKSMQELFGVSAPGGGFLGDANTPGTNDLSNMFVPGVFTPSTLSGKVFGHSPHDHDGEAGLTVVLTGFNDAHEFVHLKTTTGADGSYTFDGLLPGTYNVTVKGFGDDVGLHHIKLGVGQTLNDEDFALRGHDGDHDHDHHHHHGFDLDVGDFDFDL